MWPVLADCSLLKDHTWLKTLHLYSRSRLCVYIWNWKIRISAVWDTRLAFRMRAPIVRTLQESRWCDSHSWPGVQCRTNGEWDDTIFFSYPCQSAWHQSVIWVYGVMLLEESIGWLHMAWRKSVLSHSLFLSYEKRLNWEKTGWKILNKKRRKWETEIDIHGGFSLFLQIGTKSLIHMHTFYALKVLKYECVIIIWYS